MPVITRVCNGQSGEQDILTLHSSRVDTRVIFQQTFINTCSYRVGAPRVHPFVGGAPWKLGRRPILLLRNYLTLIFVSKCSKARWCLPQRVAQANKTCRSLRLNPYSMLLLPCLAAKCLEFFHDTLNRIETSCRMHTMIILSEHCLHAPILFELVDGTYTLIFFTLSIVFILCIFTTCIIYMICFIHAQNKIQKRTSAR